jgi:hypothetical protein
MLPLFMYLRARDVFVLCIVYPVPKASEEIHYLSEIEQVSMVADRRSVTISTGYILPSWYVLHEREQAKLVWWSRQHTRSHFVLDLRSILTPRQHTPIWKYSYFVGTNIPIGNHRVRWHRCRPHPHRDLIIINKPRPFNGLQTTRGA